MCTVVVVVLAVFLSWECRRIAVDSPLKRWSVVPAVALCSRSARRSKVNLRALITATGGNEDFRDKKQQRMHEKCGL